MAVGGDHLNEERTASVIMYVCMNLSIYLLNSWFICRHAASELQIPRLKKRKKRRKKRIYISYTTTGLTETLETENKTVAIVWPFVCSSFAEQCISFDGK